MCSIAIALTAAATAVSAYGKYQQGQQQRALGEYNAQVAENNARVQEMAAADALQRGQVEEDAQRRRARQIMGAQRAAFAAQGGALTDQSTAAILGDTAAFGELDALTIRNNAAREAWGLRVGAANSMADAGAARFQGRAAARAGTMGAVGTILGGAAQGYDLWRRQNPSGGGSGSTPGLRIR